MAMADLLRKQLINKTTAVERKTTVDFYSWRKKWVATNPFPGGAAGSGHKTQPEFWSRASYEELPQPQSDMASVPEI
jgi:hypothetical protein